MKVAIMVEVTSRRMECTLLTSNYSRCTTMVTPTKKLHLPRCSWTAALSIKPGLQPGACRCATMVTPQRSYISPDVAGRQRLQSSNRSHRCRRAQTSRPPSQWSLEGNLIHFGWQAHLSLIDGGEGMLQPLQLRCIHAQLSQQWDLAPKSRMGTKMLQTTNGKLPTAILIYKPNGIYE